MMLPEAHNSVVSQGYHPCSRWSVHVNLGIMSAGGATNDRLLCVWIQSVTNTRVEQVMNTHFRCYPAVSFSVQGMSSASEVDLPHGKPLTAGSSILRTGRINLIAWSFRADTKPKVVARQVLTPGESWPAYLCREGTIYRRSVLDTL